LSLPKHFTEDDNADPLSRLQLGQQKAAVAETRAFRRIADEQLGVAAVD
jgi:hypothetical protein